MSEADTDCVFCARIAERDYARDLGSCVVFAPLNPCVADHMLVVPRRHVMDPREDPVVAGEVMRCAGVYAAEVGDCNLIVNCGPVAGQTVFHLHLHVVPRRPGDGVRLPWTE